MSKDKEKERERGDKQTYSVEAKIAEGSYANIYAAKHKKSGHRVAEGLGDETVENEIRLLQQAKHPNVIPFVAGWKANHWFIAMDLARCDLTAVYARQEIPDNILAKIFHDCCTALAFLHSAAILHRDIKCANLLISNEGVVQLTDFGISVKVQGEGETALMGSPYWIAPEVILVSAQFKPYSFPADMWSFGISILEAGDGAIPRGNLSERAVLSEITRQPPPRFAKRKPSGDLQSLVNALLNKDPSVRPTAAQCLQVPWFTSACTREELKAYFDAQLAPVAAPTALAASSSGDEIDVLSRKKLSGRFDNWISKAKERRDKTEARAVSPNRRDSPQRARAPPIPLNSDQFGKDDNGNLFLKKATLDQALDFIISQPQELTFLSTFFITHRSFTSSEKVLAAFRQRFEAEAGKEGMQNRIRICILLKHWVANHWDDFDEQFLAQFVEVIKTVVQPVIASSANIVLQLIEKKKQGPPPKTQETPRRVALTVDKWIPDHMVAVSPAEVARQLTMMEQETFVSLKANEFLGRNWLRADKDSAAPNIGNAIRRFNRISNFWATEVLRQPSTAQRVVYIEWLLRLANEFHTLQNYSSLLQITSALQSTPIWRLTETWDEITPKDKNMFEFYKGLVSSGQNWAQQRDALLQKAPPSIPFVGMYLTELVFLEESGATVEDNIINFEKPRKVASIIQEIQLLQGTRYNFEVLDFVRNYFLNVEPLSEAKRFERSFAIQSRAVPVRQTSVSDVTAVPKLPIAASSSPTTSPRLSVGRPVTSPIKSTRLDVDVLRSALMDTTGEIDRSASKLYGTMQKAVAQYMKAKGGVSVLVTDTNGIVYGCSTKVTIESFEVGGKTYVLSWRLVASRADVMHCKRLVAAYSTYNNNAPATGLLVTLQLESEEVSDFAREQDVTLILLNSRPKSTSVSPTGRP